MGLGGSAKDFFARNGACFTGISLSPAGWVSSLGAMDTNSSDSSSSQPLSDELYYSRTHEWSQVDENLVTVGVTRVLLNQIGEVLYVDLPEDGQKLVQGQTFGTIESVLHVHDLASPVTGTVVEVNMSVIEDPSLISDKPFDEGWILRIEMDSEKDLAALVRSKEYAAMNSSKESR